MNKQSITFQANEQKLIKTGGIEHYASNIVAYIEATFELGANWSGYDSVRAVWSNDYLTDISTVLDNNGKCIVPTEVLTDTGKVTVNLVGSIADGDVLTDRLTTYPCKAVVVDADAKVEGEETESITPSQFEQFVEIVHDEVEQVTGMTAEAETLPAGSDATASYSDGVLSLGIPKGDKGEQGEQGETGHTGEPAGFGDVTASVDNTVGTPSVVVNTSGPDTAKEFDFEFHNLKGEQGDTGETGATGNGIASAVLNPDYTLTITFTDGTSYTTPSIRGAKGDTGNTGATGNGIQSTVLNADYTLTITFTDGTSYTTPSIRGEQGPAGPVSDVTVNGTSVVDQNGVAKILMPELTKTVQGNPITIDDAFGEVKKLDVELLPIQDLHGYDKPWSAGAINKVNTQNLPVTITSQSIVDEYQTTKQTTWTVSVNCTNNASIVGSLNLYAYNGNTLVRYKSTLIPVGTTDQMISATLDLSADTITKLQIVIAGASAGYSITVSGAQINEGQPLDQIYPYANICPITGHDSVTVGVTGKNLLSLPVVKFSDASATIANCFLVRAGTYMFSYSASVSHRIGIRVLNTDGTINTTDKPSSTLYYNAQAEAFYSGSNVPSGNQTLILVFANDCYVRIVSNLDGGGLSDAQLELGSTATPYAPYHGQSKTVTLPSTTYGADVDVTGGQGKVTMQMVDLGSLTWIKAGTSSNPFFRADLADAKQSTGAAGMRNAICSSYPMATNGQAIYNGDEDKCFIINTTYLGAQGYLYVRDTDYNDVNAATFKTAMNGIDLCYELATPTALSTTPTDISLYNGDNVISSDGNITMEYVRDIAIVIQKIENQL